MVAFLAFLLTFLLASALAGLPSNAEDAALLQAALTPGRGQAAARNRLAVRLAPVIRARLRRALSGTPDGRIGAHDLDDLTHLTWCRLLEHDAARLRAFDPAAGLSLVGYVSMVAAQLFLNVLEQHRAGKRTAAATVALDDAEAGVELPAPGDAAAAHQARADLARLFAHLMTALPARGQAVLQALYGDGLDVDEAARLLGVERQVVYNWQFKIRQLARERLQGAP